MTEVTRILAAIEQGDPQAAEQLLPLVYDELRRLAAQKLAQEKPGPDTPGHGPGPRGVPAPGRTSKKAQHWNSRGHFFAAAAEAMRRILVDEARRKRADKRGGDRQRSRSTTLDGRLHRTGRTNCSASTRRSTSSPRTTRRPPSSSSSATSPG